MYPIHLMSYYTQQNAKTLVEHQMRRKHGFGFERTPINLIGIGYGKIIVQVDDETHPANYYIPTELDELTGFGGLPVDIEYGSLYHLQGRRGGGGGGGIQGGGAANCQGQGGESGTIMLVGKGVQDPNNKYAVVSHHCTRGCTVGCSLGGQSVRVHKSSGCGKTFWEGCAMGPVQGNTSIKGLGEPKGIQKPAIGMQCNSNSQTSGSLKAIVKAINFNAPRSTSLGTGACSISIQDMFQAHPCPTHGDSGGCEWNENGYVIGIITYGSDDKGGRNNSRCNSYNPSAIHMPEVIGVTCGSGVAGGGTPSSQPTQQQRGAQQRRQGGGSGWDLGNWLSDLEQDWNVPIPNPEILHPELATGYAANQCVIKGLIWYQNKILDTGTPNGGPSYRGAPAAFYNMIQLYQGHNLVIDKESAYLYPASNNRATGQAQKLNSCPNGPLTKPAKGCSPSLSSTGGDRFINGQMQTKSGNWISWKFMVDSGASFMMCTASQMRQLGLQPASDNCDLRYTATLGYKIPPAKASGQMPIGTRDYGQRGFTPTSPVIMSNIVKIAITKDYTILTAQDGSGSMTYPARGGSGQQGDKLNGAWEYGGNKRSFDSFYVTVA